MASQPVRVIINDRCLRNARTGVGHYVCELLAALPGVDPGIELLPFYRTYLRRGNSDKAADGGESPQGDLHKKREIRPPIRPPDWLRRLLQRGYETAFEAIGTWKRFRLYHEPNHIPGPWNGPVMTTIHDLSVLRYPEWHPLDRVRWYERDFLAALPRSAHFISVSEFTKREMMQLLGIKEDRITTIPLGPRAIFHPRPADAVRAWLAARGLPPEYLLFVGTMEPRKNIGGLLAAYARLPREQQRRFPLLIVGGGGWAGRAGASPVLTLAESIRRLGLTPDPHARFEPVHVLGYVSDEDLSWLYAGARALVWPTFYEGFGLPPLECMATGTPVITSRAASLPEVVGKAGLLVDPNNPEEIAESMRRIIEDDHLAEDLARRGIARSKEFSWARCAAAHAAIYRKYGT